MRTLLRRERHYGNQGGLHPAFSAGLAEIEVPSSVMWRFCFEVSEHLNWSPLSTTLTFTVAMLSLPRYLGQFSYRHSIEARRYWIASTSFSGSFPAASICSQQGL